MRKVLVGLMTTGYGGVQTVSVVINMSDDYCAGNDSENGYIKLRKAIYSYMLHVKLGTVDALNYDSSRTTVIAYTELKDNFMGNLKVTYVINGSNEVKAEKIRTSLGYNAIDGASTNHPFEALCNIICGRINKRQSTSASIQSDDIFIISIEEMDIERNSSDLDEYVIGEPGNTGEDYESIIDGLRHEIKELCVMYSSLSFAQRIELLMFLCQYMEITCKKGVDDTSKVDNVYIIRCCPDKCKDNAACVLKAYDDLKCRYASREQSDSWRDAWDNGHVEAILKYIGFKEEHNDKECSDNPVLSAVGRMVGE